MCLVILGGLVEYIRLLDLINIYLNLVYSIGYMKQRTHWEFCYNFFVNLFYKQLQFKSVYIILKELELQNIKMCLNNFIKMKFVTIRCYIFYCWAQCPVSRHLFLTSPALFSTSVASNIPWSLKIGGLTLYFYCWPFTVAFKKNISRTKRSIVVWFDHDVIHTDAETLILYIKRLWVFLTNLIENNINSKALLMKSNSFKTYMYPLRYAIQV